MSLKILVAYLLVSKNIKKIEKVITEIRINGVTSEV